MPTAIILMGLRGSGKTTLEYNLRRLLIPDWPNLGDHSIGKDVVFIGPCRNSRGWMLSGGAERIMREKWVEPPRDGSTCSQVRLVKPTMSKHTSSFKRWTSESLSFTLQRTRSGMKDCRVDHDVRTFLTEDN